MKKQWVVSSSPHLRDDSSTTRIMLDVCIALLPAGIASVLFFGIRAAILIAAAVLSAVVFEWGYQRITNQKNTISDLSAVVTGLLLAYNLPAGAPVWMAVVGSFIAIILVKQVFGGLGQNFMNPALAARAILFISWIGIMTRYPNAQFGQFMVGYSEQALDTISTATPLLTKNTGLWSLFIGNVPGVLGETSKLAIILGGIYLLVRRVIDWKIPLFFILTVFVAYFTRGTIAAYNNPSQVVSVMAAAQAGAQSGLYQLLSGGLMLGAFFMATDYATSPVTNVGRVIMGIGCGLILFVIREFATYPEGCSFAILFMNVATPLIDKLTIPKTFGEVAKHA